MSPADLDSRGRILDAAALLFSRQGFAATSIKDIGKASQRNTALIHYYFESKEQLYREVLSHALEQMIGGVGQAVATDLQPEDALRAFVRAQVAFLRQRPHLLPLFVREMTDWGAAHAADQIHHLSATIFRRLCGYIEQGQQQGVFRRDVDPRFTAISLVAQVNWLMLARPAVGVLLGRGLGEVTDNDVDAFAENAARLIISGLKATAEPTARSVARPPAARAPRRARRTS